MYTNPCKERLSQGELVLCRVINQGRTNDVVMMAASAGFHAIFVDMEHSAFSLETVSMLFTAALGLGLAPMVRVMSKSGQEFGTLFDIGAQGIIVPHVNTAAEAKAIVARCKFLPLRTRSVTAIGPHLGYQSRREQEIIAHMNEQTQVFAIIEFAEGAKNLEEIAAVPGIDALHVACRDLCTDLGIPGDYRHPRMTEIYQRAAAACRANDKAMGIGGVRGDAEYQGELYRMGARFMTIGSDSGYILAGGRKDVSAITGAVGTLTSVR